jgi:hypothetical protein
LQGSNLKKKIYRGGNTKLVYFVGGKSLLTQNKIKNFSVYKIFNVGYAQKDINLNMKNKSLNAILDLPILKF